MAGKIGQQSPKAPQWPWGGPRSVRERLVDPRQVARANKKGDPTAPALPSMALLDSIGPAHSAEEMRLSMPPPPEGHQADLHAFTTRNALAGAVERRLDDQALAQLSSALNGIKASPERVERLKSQLQREANMLDLIAQVHNEMYDIERRRREETVAEAL